MVMLRVLDRPPGFGLLAAPMLLPAIAVLADAPLKTAQVQVGKHALRVEIVETPEQMAKGLMFREKLGRNDGMLFIYDEPGYHSMWMKNTLIALSVAFIDRNGAILNIEDMEPKTLDSHSAAGPARYSIETNKGWFAEKKIKPGDKVTGLPGVRP